MIDGTRSDTIIAGKTPAFDMMMKNGLWTMEAMTQDGILTSSAPGWKSILTGVSPSKHHLFGNFNYWLSNDDYKSFLWHGRVEEGLKTLVLVNM